MLYESTRGWPERVAAPEAIAMGIAPDGGLFVPVEKEHFPNLDSLANRSYPELAARILTPYLTGFPPDMIKTWTEKAYSSARFDSPEITPLRQLTEELHILELWHGPTSAFKDIALQLMPYLLTAAREKKGIAGEVVILVATSGDTGKAALEAFRDVKDTRVIVFFPEEGVSGIQKSQMITQEGGNVSVVAVRGNFDDAQNGVKEIFSDGALRETLSRKGFSLSSANSINWGRLVPQIVYYFHAYLEFLNKGNIETGEKIDFVVPTGNFGNILAGFYAREMGLPVGKLICASNLNNVLTGFINSGIYDRSRPFYRTASPSMDILVSSNLERLLFELSGKDAKKVHRWMDDLQEHGRYKVDPYTAGAIGELFWSDFADDGETYATIKRIYSRYSYLLDTHTAVGLAVYEKYRPFKQDMRKTIILSTASPFKFNDSVARALLDEDAVRGKSEFALPDILSQKTGWAVPPGLRNLESKPILHNLVVDREKMKEAVVNILG